MSKSKPQKAPDGDAHGSDAAYVKQLREIAKQVLRQLGTLGLRTEFVQSARDMSEGILSLETQTVDNYVWALVTTLSDGNAQAKLLESVFRAIMDKKVLADAEVHAATETGDSAGSSPGNRPPKPQRTRARRKPSKGGTADPLPSDDSSVLDEPDIIISLVTPGTMVTGSPIPERFMITRRMPLTEAEQEPVVPVSVKRERDPLREANETLRRLARDRLQALVTGGYSPTPGVEIPNHTAIVLQAAAALLMELLERTTAPQDLVYQLATIIVSLTQKSDDSAGGWEGIVPA